MEYMLFKLYGKRSLGLTTDYTHTEGLKIKEMHILSLYIIVNQILIYY